MEKKVFEILCKKAEEMYREYECIYPKIGSICEFLAYMISFACEK